MLKITICRLKGLASLTVFILGLLIPVTGCGSSQAIYQPGTYVNQAEGYYSTLIVEVTVDERQIIDIKVTAHEEPKILSDIVFSQLPAMIKKKNSVDVDEISGATYTSRALIEAVSDALSQAKEALE